MPTESLSLRMARRLALSRAGLLKPTWTGLPSRAAGNGARARKGAHAILGRFGYLQLDSVAVSGARSHALVLLSRLEGFDPALGEQLLAPGEPLFEYWGHEACWLPMDLYPTFGFRRRDYAHHPWWGDVLGENPKLADELLVRIREHGPVRSLDLEGDSGEHDGWARKLTSRVVLAFWCRGDLAIRSRRNFQRTFDLAERVIPADLRKTNIDRPQALKTLLLRALAGHGWSTTGTLAATWRLRNLRTEIATALDELVAEAQVVPCTLETPGSSPIRGWARPEDLALADRLDALRPRQHRGVLLSPFDPVLWDRGRVQQLFDFDQILEIFKPKAQREYGYYCLPVLAGERLVARVDLKADRKHRKIALLSTHFEADPVPAVHREAVASAIERYEGAIGMPVVG